MMEEGVSLLDGVGGGPVTLTEVLGDFAGDFDVAEPVFLCDVNVGGRGRRQLANVAHMPGGACMVAGGRDRERDC